MSTGTARGGFSLVEVIVAMVILSVGILAMAATTGHIFTRLRDSGLETERTLAVQQVAERLRALPFDSIDARDATAPDTVGAYRFWWSVSPTPNLKRVSIVSEGPGYAGTTWTTAVQDSTLINIFRPWP